MENRAYRTRRRHPNPPIVRVDDRAANRETHSHTTRFGREQRLEYPVYITRIDAGAKSSIETCTWPGFSSSDLIRKILDVT